MVMLLCKGPLLRIWASPLHWRYAKEITAATASKATGGRSAGDVLIILSCVAWAGWLVLQVHNRSHVLTTSQTYNLTLHFGR